MSDSPDEIIAGYGGWLRTVASHLTDSANVDDLIQEGRIAMWMALGSYNPERGALSYWLTYRARNRMLEVVQGKLLTGQPPRHHGPQGIREPQNTRSLDEELFTSGSYDGLTVADVAAGPDRTEEACQAYHGTDIARALASLTQQQRRYVVSRFWLGMTTAEMKAEVFGYDPSGLWNSPKNGAKHKLRISLSHLGYEHD